MKHIITIALILGGCLAIGDTAASIGLAAGMIALAVILTIVPARRKS